MAIPRPWPSGSGLPKIFDDQNHRPAVAPARAATATALKMPVLVLRSKSSNGSMTRSKPDTVAPSINSSAASEPSSIALGTPPTFFIPRLRESPSPAKIASTGNTTAIPNAT